MIAVGLADGRWADGTARVITTGVDRGIKGGDVGLLSRRITLGGDLKMLFGLRFQSKQLFKYASIAALGAPVPSTMAVSWFPPEHASLSDGALNTGTVKDPCFVGKLLTLVLACNASGIPSRLLSTPTYKQSASPSQSVSMPATATGGALKLPMPPLCGTVKLPTPPCGTVKLPIPPIRLLCIG
jgi:hypothetical protein